MVEIGSIEDFRQYLEECPQSGGELLPMVRHLVCLMEDEDDVPDRNFWLNEAGSYHAVHLTPEARAFVAKRVFAFIRKKLFPVIRANLAFFPINPSTVVPRLALSILQFEPLPDDVRAELAREISAGQQPQPDGPIREVLETREGVPAPEIEAPVQSVSPESFPEEALPEPEIEEPGPISPESLPEQILPEPEIEQVQSAGSLVPEIVPEQRQRTWTHRAKPERGDNKADVSRRCEDEIKAAWDRIDSAKISPVLLPRGAAEWFAKLGSKGGHRFPEIIQGVLLRYQEQQEKYGMMCLKNLVAQHAKTISDPSTLLVCINYGKKKTDKILEKFSRLTGTKAVNRMIYRYLLGNLEAALRQHVEDFRRGLEKCGSREKFLSFLDRYPLWDKSLVHKYPSLDIIKRARAISDKVHSGGDFSKVIFKYLGAGEANIQRHLFRILISGDMHSKLQESFAGVANINQLLKQLRELKKIPETRYAANTLFQLVVTFLRKRSQISFQSLKVSLNFLPPKLQQQIAMPIQRKARRDLEAKIQKLLGAQGRVEKRWKKLLELLQSSEFHDLEMGVLGYTPREWLDKLSLVAHSEGDIAKTVHHIFSRDRVPHSLLELIIERHQFRFSAEIKTIHSCCRELVKLRECARSREILSLKRPIMNLLQVYGQVEFSRSAAQSLNGYELARLVGKFYCDPQRTTIALPDHLRQEIAEILASAVDEERAHQLDFRR